jgi:hypothetical protein
MGKARSSTCRSPSALKDSEVMCYSEAASFAAAVLCTVMSLTIPRFVTPSMSSLYTVYGLLASSMEWLQFLGYRHPTVAAIPYAATVHVILQPVGILAVAVAISRENRDATPREVIRTIREHAIVRLAVVCSAVVLLRLVWGEPTLPCNDLFCGLLDDTTPRCVLASPHMTWTVPLRTLPTGLYGTIHLMTYHFIFLSLAPALICPLAAILTWLPVCYAIIDTRIPTSYYDASILGSVWCYSAVIAACLSPILDRLVTATRCARLRQAAARKTGIKTLEEAKKRAL